jgi:cellulose synthase/poly-beta-1,6-N-acetylglucosamine synthase-like glycosyltransferase
VVRTLLVAAAIVLGLPGFGAALQLGLLAVASWFYRSPRGDTQAGVRFLVLVPAHNEERVIGTALAAISADARSADHVLVVADRCTDATAEIARGFGAHVLERGVNETAGRAAARQAGLHHARSLTWDAVIMLDADSVIEPGFFAACERAMGPETAAIQARSESSRGRTLATEASLAAFTLQGITLPRGRQRLGLSVRLRGTGMGIRREVALAHSFHAPASEDLFFTLDLLLNGVHCRHVDEARLRSVGEERWGAFGGQKVRYEAGRMSASRAHVPQLLRRAFRQRDIACLDAAWFLSVPPFAISILLLIIAAGLAVLAHAWPLVAVLGSGFLMLAVALVTGLIQARAGLRTWLALGAAPWYLVWKAVVQVRALAKVLGREAEYGPTARV